MGLLEADLIDGWVSQIYPLGAGTVVLCANKPFYFPSGKSVPFGAGIPPVYGMFEINGRVLATCAGGLYRVENLEQTFPVRGAWNWSGSLVQFVVPVDDTPDSNLIVAGHEVTHRTEQWTTRVALHNARGDFLHFVGPPLGNFKLRGLERLMVPNPILERPIIAVFGNDNAFFIEPEEFEAGGEAKWEHFSNHTDLHQVRQCWTHCEGTGRRKFDLWAATECGLKCWEWGDWKWSNVRRGAFYALHPAVDTVGRHVLYAAAEEGLCVIPGAKGMLLEWEDGKRPTAFIERDDGLYLARVHRGSRTTSFEKVFAHDEV